MSDQTGKTSRRVKIILFVSLALNLLVAGMVAGHFIGGGNDRDRRGPEFVAGSGPFLAAMPPEARREFLETVRGRVGGSAVERGGRKAAVRRMAEIIGAEPFSREDLEAEMAQQREFAQNLTRNAQDALVDWVSDLDDENRAAFAGRLNQMADERGRR